MDISKNGTFQRLSDVKVAVVYVPSLGVALCGGILPLARLFMFGLYDTMQSMKLVPFRPSEPCSWGGMLEAKLPMLNQRRSFV